MYVNGMDVDRLERGVERAIQMMVDDQMCAVVIIGVMNDARGVRVWSGGDERVADQVKATITQALPFKPSLPPRLREPEDGA